jgi:hypothetical protein
MLHNFVQKVVKSGGRLVPLMVPSEDIKNPSLTNPSILNDNNKIIVNLRNVNYCLYHSENNINEHHWGPLCYLHPENNWILQTFNILCEIDHNLNIFAYSTIDTTKLDIEPKWEFVGLEDGRLVKWDNILYLSGVRRDTTTHGEGRIELSSLELSPDNKVIETSRNRIPAPPPNNSYCEKNWMPILDMPYHYVKWTNPTEVVKYDINNKTCETLKTTEYREFNTGDLRGGSQVLKIKDYYFAIVHEVDLFNSEAGRKNAIYYHRIVLWNQNFELVKISDRFNFMGAKIEFCCGMAEYQDYYLITFGFQDNASYLLAAPKQFIYDTLQI